MQSPLFVWLCWDPNWALLMLGKQVLCRGAHTLVHPIACPVALFVSLMYCLFLKRCKNYVAWRLRTNFIDQTSLKLSKDPLTLYLSKVGIAGMYHNAGSISPSHVTHTTSPHLPWILSVTGCCSCMDLGCQGSTSPSPWKDSEIQTECTIQ